MLQLLYFLCLLNVTFGSKCPLKCECQGVLVDCSYKGLNSVPKNIPKNTQVLLLQHNNLSHVLPQDFARLIKLKQLNLESNRINQVSSRAFEDLVNLKSLNLGGNEIRCIRDNTFRNLLKLETLTLSENRLTYFQRSVFKRKVPQLLRLRLHSNYLRCDCHLRWLRDYLSRSKMDGLAILAQCHEPFALRGQYISKLDRNYYKCDSNVKLPACEYNACPSHCECSSNGIVDCGEKRLINLPTVLPKDTKLLKLVYNSFEEIPDYVFSDFKSLEVLYLNYNGILRVDGNAFQGLPLLKDLHLQHNQIADLPASTFRNLKKLRQLYLQENKITCLKRSTFSGLRNLTNLNLYGNRIQALPEGIFAPLRNLKNLYLGGNPFQCDCKLRWLTRYLRRNGVVEKSRVKCYGPKPLFRREIKRIRRKRFRSCPAGLATRQDSCLIQSECPDKCKCAGSKIVCSGLKEIPRNIPTSVSVLDLRYNDIQVVNNNGIFKNYNSLKTIDLSQNKIKKIEKEAFNGAVSLTELRINDNLLTDLHGVMFSGLPSLKILQIRNNRISCLGNHSFVGLEHLKEIDLYSNEIGTIDQGSFDYLQDIETLNILSNNLNCDCRLSWMHDWLLRNNHVSMGKPRCSSPHNNRNFPIADIRSHDFRCDGILMAQCTPKKKCPKNCKCSNGVVRCSNLNFDRIPVEDIPNDVIELYMERNNVVKIPLEINNFTRLKILDLSENKIQRLLSNQFVNLTSLQSLLLGYNQIQCADQNAFRGLFSLQTLSLHSNNLSTINEGALEKLENIRRLGFGENPWHCDCNMRWLVIWMMDRRVDAGIARCHGPQSMSGQLIVSKSPESFNCNGPLDVEIAAKCNPCLISPCKYESTCLPDDSSVYKCLCKTGFKGRNCETPIEPCILKPCKNGGKCHALSEQNYQCSCIDGFNGKNCEINIDDCTMTSCTGTHEICVDGINNFTCQCKNGWAGERCAIQVGDKCQRLKPCKNGATCVNIQKGKIHDYQCQCTRRYVGRNCSEVIKVCTENRCQNGAICQEDLALKIGYRCNCAPGFIGQFCDLEETGERVSILRDDPCTNNDCANDAVCHATTSTAAGFKCLCQPGFTGTLCQSLTSVTLTKNGSHIDLSHRFKDNNKIATLTLYISTNKDNGILFYWGNNPITSDKYDFVSVEFFSGHVKVKRSLKNEESITLYSPEPVNDGTTHKIEVEVRENAVSIQIDDENKISRDIRFDQSSEEFTIMQIGGVSPQLLEFGTKMWFFSDSKTFEGCIHAFFFNQQMIDFESLSDIRGSTEDIRAGSWVGDIFTSSCTLSCEHGSCIVDEDEDMSCVCMNGYSGILCEVPENFRAFPCNQDNNLCNHGKCFISTKTMQAYCECEKGYSGDRCEFSGSCGEKDCFTGSCIKTHQGYQCKCPKSYTGDRCQTKVRSCRGVKTRKFYMSPKFPSSPHSKMTCRSLRRFVDVSCHSSSSSCGAQTCCRPVRVQARRIRMRCQDGSVVSRKVLKVRRCGCVATCG